MTQIIKFSLIYSVVNSNQKIFVWKLVGPYISFFWLVLLLRSVLTYS